MLSRSPWAQSSLRAALVFTNGKSSPPRDSRGAYSVFGSNGEIGKANERNSDANTIIIGRVGSYCGSLHYSNRACWVTDNAIRANAISGHDSKFAYYLLGTLELNRWRSGSGQPLLNQATLNAIPAYLPGYQEQCRIGQILSSFDERIHLLRRTNETLEAMARAIFKSWFVDFDPVRVKAEGSEPVDMDAATAALFPSEFQDSELGKLPRGWQATTLGKQVERADGRIQTGPFGSQLHASDYTTEGIPVVMPQDISNRRVRDAYQLRDGNWLEVQITDEANAS